MNSSARLGVLLCAAGVVAVGAPTTPVSALTATGVAMVNGEYAPTAELNVVYSGTAELRMNDQEANGIGGGTKVSTQCSAVTHRKSHAIATDAAPAQTEVSCSVIDIPTGRTWTVGSTTSQWHAKGGSPLYPDTNGPFSFCINAGVRLFDESERSSGMQCSPFTSQPGPREAGTLVARVTAGELQG